MVFVCVLVCEFKLLLFDELFVVFDVLICVKMYGLVMVLWCVYKFVVLLVMYDVDEVIVLVDCVLVFDVGWIVVEECILVLCG